MRRIEMIERLRAREDTARALINATSDTAFLMELDGTILALNDKLALSFNCRGRRASQTMDRARGAHGPAAAPGR